MNPFVKLIENSKFLSSILFKVKRRNKSFPGSTQYWQNRYIKGGNSGAGSYNELAKMKAETINQFVITNNIQQVIEFGCGDGNQLSLYEFNGYIGLDVSSHVVERCIERFKDDKTKSFMLYNSEAFCDNHQILLADLTLSIDVIYHLVEDQVFRNYMTHLFYASKKYVLIYASNFDTEQRFHEKNRHFTLWIDDHLKDWKLIEKIENPFSYEFNNRKKTSKADFYVYKKIETRTD